MWKLPKCPSMDKENVISKKKKEKSILYIQWNVVASREMLTLAITWRKMLIEISKSQNDKYCMVPLI